MQIISKSIINYCVVCVCYIKGNYDMFGFVFLLYIISAFSWTSNGFTVIA